MSERIKTFENELRSLGDVRDAATAEAENIEAQLLEIDGRVAEANEEIHRAETDGAANRERVAASESIVEHRRNLARDLENTIARLRNQLAEMSARAGDLHGRLQATADDLTAAETNHGRVTDQLSRAERALSETIDSLDRLRAEHERHRAECLQKMREVAALGNEIGSLEGQAEAAAETQRRCGRKLEEIDRTKSTIGRRGVEASLREPSRRGRSKRLRDYEASSQDRTGARN